VESAENLAFQLSALSALRGRFAISSAALRLAGAPYPAASYIRCRSQTEDSDAYLSLQESHGYSESPMPLSAESTVGLLGARTGRQSISPLQRCAIRAERCRYEQRTDQRSASSKETEIML
jgi:hypothetical protein